MDHDASSNPDEPRRPSDGVLPITDDTDERIPARVEHPDPLATFRWQSFTPLSLPEDLLRPTCQFPQPPPRHRRPTESESLERERRGTDVNPSAATERRQARARAKRRNLPLPPRLHIPRVEGRTRMPVSPPALENPTAREIEVAERSPPGAEEVAARAEIENVDDPTLRIINEGGLPPFHSYWPAHLRTRAVDFARKRDKVIELERRRGLQYGRRPSPYPHPYQYHPYPYPYPYPVRRSPGAGGRRVSRGVVKKRSPEWRGEDPRMMRPPTGLASREVRLALWDMQEDMELDNDVTPRLSEGPNFSPPENQLGHGELHTASQTRNDSVSPESQEREV